MTAPPPSHSLHLDGRQRAMLLAMGVTAWWPAEAPAAQANHSGTGHAAPAATESFHKKIADNPIRTSATRQKDSQFTATASTATGHTPTKPNRPQPPEPTQRQPVAAAPTRPAPPAVAHLDGSALHAAIAQCQACGLCQGRTQAVPGAGPQPAAWMVVLDTPSEDEDRAGLPMAGPDGPLLRAMLAAMGLDSAQDVFVTHALKCRGQLNRNPSADDMALCRTHLLRQLELVQPRMVLALGRLATQTLLGPDWPAVAQLPLGKLRGRVHSAAGVPVVVSYPPQTLLRSPADKAKAWDDLCLAMTHVGHSPWAGTPTAPPQAG